MIRVTDEEVRSAKPGELLIVERSKRTPANPNRLKTGVYYLYNGVTKSLTSLLQLTGSIAWGQITGNLTSQADLKAALDAKANDADISLVGKSNDYNDLDNLPSIPSPIGFTPENVANKSTSVITDQASNTKYPSVKALFDWAIGRFFDKPTGTTLQYLRGDGSLATFPSIPTVPTQVSAFTNDAGYITSAALTPIAYFFGTATHTGNADETIVQSIAIDPTRIPTNCLLTLDGRTIRSAGTVTMRAYMNSSNAIGGINIYNPTALVQTVSSGIKLNIWKSGNVWRVSNSIASDTGNVAYTEVTQAISGYVWIVLTVQCSIGTANGGWLNFNLRVS